MDDLITDIFPKLTERNTGTLRILLKEEKQYLGKHEFAEYCKLHYFEKHFKKIMSESVFTLPYNELDNSNGKPILQALFNTILKTMKNWCDKDQEEDIKGLVIFGYSLDEHLKFLKYPEDTLKNYLDNETSADFQETVTVYNPQKKVIFLLRRARDNKKLEHEMKCSINDVLKFVLLYNDVLKDSKVKLINLLISDADTNGYQWKCKFCKHHLISTKALNSSDSFQKWLKTKENSFKTDYNAGSENYTFSFDFSARLLGFLASFQFLRENHFNNWELPSLTDNHVNQMIETTILLTPEQLEIVNSPNKHLMIQGCYGSGKSLIALKKAEMTSKILKQNEILCFISYDSRSMLTIDIASTSKMKLYRNESALKLSEIINNIKKDNPKDKINLIVDEYDAEHLDKPEAEKLNQIFTKDEKLRDSIIYLVFEALGRERTVNGFKQIANQLALLKSMEFRELTWNKRNTLQIHNLVKVTTDVLKNQTTTAFIPTYNEQDSKVQLDSQKAKVQEKGEALGQVSARQHPRKEKDDDNNVRKNVNKKKFTFDEAASKYPSSLINKSVGVKSKEVKTTFQHRESKHSGHAIESDKPYLYEIYRAKGSPIAPEFILSLIVVLEQVIGKDYENIEKQVILHFDIEKDIPSIFYTAFKMMGILEKVTNKYLEFKKESGRKIFIGNFRAFRGLEYPRVVVVLDDNIRGLEQYLPECLNRCTTHLHAILLRENTHILREAQNKPITLQNVITTWKKQSKSERLIYSWIVHSISLINSWIVHIFGSDKNEVSANFYEKRDPGIIKIYSTSEKYRELKANYEKLQFFQNEDTNNDEITREEMESAVER